MPPCRAGWSRLARVSVIVLAAAAPAGARQPVPSLVLAYPELILHHGRIVTVDPASSIAEAIAVREGKVLAIGGEAEILALAGPRTKVIDLGGWTVTPGFIYNDADNSVPGGDIYK